jgi:hypothetical protein
MSAPSSPMMSKGQGKGLDGKGSQGMNNLIRTNSSEMLGAKGSTGGRGKGGMDTNGGRGNMVNALAMSLNPSHGGGFGPPSSPGGIQNMASQMHMVCNGGKGGKGSGTEPSGRGASPPTLPARLSRDGSGESRPSLDPSPGGAHELRLGPALMGAARPGPHQTDRVVSGGTRRLLWPRDESAPPPCPPRSYP